MFDDCRDGFNIYEMDIYYFQFVKEKDKNIVKCNLCVTPRVFSTSRNSTSDLKKHLDRCPTNTKLTDRAQGCDFSI